MSARGVIGVYPPLAPATAVPRPGREPGFPFDRPSLTLTHLARGAVWLALRALGLGPGKRIAMPAYHCGSEVEAAYLAGVEVAFYRVGADLRADDEDLARVAAGCDATYVISNFGFPFPSSPEGGLLIEDAAHGLFSRGPEGDLGSRGDAAIFCPRKSLGAPDGGALLLRDGIAAASGERRPARTHARSLASLGLGRAAISRVGPVRAGAGALLDRFSRTAAATRERTLTQTVIGEWGLEPRDLEAAAAPPARLTERVVRAAEPGQHRARRRRNYELLLADLAELAPEPFRSLRPGVAPLYFPALAPDRDAALARLLEHGIRGLEVWPLPHPLLDRDEFKELEPLRRGLLALPVHQALGERHMAAVLAAAKAALRP